MIIDPDMPDHWKTRVLADCIGSEAMAVMCLVRLWAHCQNRKKHVFSRLPMVAVKAICHFNGDAEELDAGLQAAGFIERDGDEIVVVGWDDHNSKMIAAWKNGKAGGRPKKEADSGNPEGTDQKPKENPTETHQKPNPNPQETGKGGKGGKEENNRSSADAPDRFADFWDVYPKRVKKAEAKKKWKARRLDRMADQIIADVIERQKRDRRWLDGFVPDPTTYINGQRWEDEIDTARKPGPSGSSDDDRARPESKVLN